MARKKEPKSKPPEYVITVPDGNYKAGDIIEGTIKKHGIRTPTPICVIVQETGLTQGTGTPYLVVRALGDPRQLTRLNTTPPVFHANIFGP